MILLPVKCESCAQIGLVEERVCSNGEAPCAGCGVSAAVLPGCAYAGTDLPLFVELRRNFEEVALGRASAAQLGFLLEDLGVSSNAGQAFSLLFEHDPALMRLRPTIEAHASRRRQALSILTMLLNDRAVSRTSMVRSTRPTESFRAAGS